MLGGNRSAGTSALAKQGDSRASSQEGAGRDRQGHEQIGAIASAIKQIPGPQEALVANQQAEAEQPNPYELRDLIAQEIMADAAIWMAIAALLTFIVTSFGTLLIWGQVRLTRQAVEDTGEATVAMREANEIARQASENEYRPILIFEGFNLQFFRAGSMLLTPKWKNIGRMPAIPIIMRTYRTYIEGNPTEDDVRKLVDSLIAAKEEGGHVMAAGEERSGPATMIRADNMEIIDAYPLGRPEGLPLMQGTERFRAKRFALIVTTVTYKSAIGRSSEWESTHILPFQPALDERANMRTDQWYVGVFANATRMT